MNNISVVIPTMWVPNTFEEQLNNLVHHVDEIIIVNNYFNNTPDWSILKHTSIKIYNQEENIYVNPAWNLGVKESKNNTICLLNDDILFDYTIFDNIDKLNELNYGVIGLEMLAPINGIVNLKPINERCWGFGCMMFFNRDNYYVIPDELKILYGDDYLFNKNKYAGKQNYVLSGLQNNRVVSATCCSDLNVKNPKLKDISDIEHKFYGSIVW